MGRDHRGSEPCTTIHLPHAAGTANAARLQMAGELRAADVPRTIVMDAEIVIGELVSNAWEHGRPDAAGNIEISWCVQDQVLRISVYDGGDVEQLKARALDPDSVRGRGLAMVDFICDNWRTDHEHPGTRVTAELTFD